MCISAHKSWNGIMFIAKRVVNLNSIWHVAVAIWTTFLERDKTNTFIRYMIDVGGWCKVVYYIVQSKQLI